jgi:hypothetical protein
VEIAIELLCVDDCPGCERLRPALRRLADEHGAQLVERRVATPEDAVAQRFLGSPTVRVDGVDVEPGAGERTDYGLKCRLYRPPGGAAQQPAAELILQALASRSNTAAIRCPPQMHIGSSP